MYRYVLFRINRGGETLKKAVNLDEERYFEEAYKMYVLAIKTFNDSLESFPYSEDIVKNDVRISVEKKMKEVVHRVKVLRDFLKKGGRLDSSDDEELIRLSIIEASSIVGKKKSSDKKSPRQGCTYQKLVLIVMFLIKFFVVLLIWIYFIPYFMSFFNYFPLKIFYGMSTCPFLGVWILLFVRDLKNILN